MHGLNPILGKGSHLKVLRVLHRAGGPLSGREIQRRSGLSNRAVMMALESLESTRTVQVSREASRYHVDINPKHYLWRTAVRPALEAEDEFWEDFQKLVRRVIKPRPVAAMVTGVLARDEAEEGGVVDLHLLFEKGRQRLQAYRCLERIQTQMGERYGLEVEVTFMDLTTMEHAEFQDLWHTIALEGILLFGKLP